MDTLNQNVLNGFQSFLIKTKYKNIIKELKLEYCTDEEGINYMYLVSIQIKKSQREKGYGSAILSEIVQLADNHNVRLHLFATNIFGAELKRLYGFYKKHGFILIKKTGDGHMIYYPKKKNKNCNLLVSLSV
jgi:L-amino acid N-acyltransferase YncA